MNRGKIVAPILSDDSSSEDEVPLARIRKSPKPGPSSTQPKTDGSSSDSDIGNYLQPVSKLDLSSPFFQHSKSDNGEEEAHCSKSRILSSSDDENVQEEKTAAPIEYYNFNQLTEYTKKIEATKKAVEQYETKKATQNQQLDILNLLTAGESKLSEDKQKILREMEATLHSSDFESSSDSEGKNVWEEVKSQDKAQSSKRKSSKAGIQITVEMPGNIKKKKGVDLLTAMKRRFNNIKKENQVLVHKVHLLCWIGHGNYVNSCINSPSVLGAALSLLPSEKCYPTERTDLAYLEQILKWYRGAVDNLEKPMPKNLTLRELLEKNLQKQQTCNKRIFVFLFVAVLRSLGIQCRLVFSFQVQPLRPPASELCSLKTEENSKSVKKTPRKKAKTAPTQDHSPTGQPEAKTESSGVKTAPNIRPRARSERSAPKSQESKNLVVDLKKLRSGSASDINKKDKIDPPLKTQVKTTLKSTRSRAKSEKTEPPKNPAVNLEKLRTSLSSGLWELQKSNAEAAKAETSRKRTKSKNKTPPKKAKKEIIKIKLPPKKTRVPQVDGMFDTSDDETPEKPNLRRLKRRKPLKKVPGKLAKLKDTDSEDDFHARSPFAPKKNVPAPNLRKLRSSGKPADVREDIKNLIKERIKEEKHLSSQKLAKNKRKKVAEDGEDSDYAPEIVKKKPHDSEDEFKPKVKQRVQVKSRKVLSSDSENESGSPSKRRGVDVWAEVFLESEEKWISVDVIKGQVHCVNELYARATHPVAYIVAWSNDSHIKDLTRKYCKNFNTITRKLRVDAKWWQSTIKPYLGPNNARNREEDEELERQQLEQPLPKSIAEYKNHPLYVLKRHLLKFEAIYPPNAATLGFIRSEAVYSRQCVYTLHSREIWLKQAKVVKMGEKPYKIVKARPKYDKLSNTMITDQLLEIFGPWQTEDYDPPTAENGVVPRNAYGNVELFKACMLPKKTVHLQLPGLDKIARRMNIDCAAAVVGFDFHCGWSHPTFDGFVVCEEFADTLVIAWDVEQEEMQKREQEKLEKRVYGNWRKLIRGLLIRERLVNKYDFGEPSSGAPKKAAPKAPTLKTKKK